jgi:hypothetical protein
MAGSINDFKASFKTDLAKPSRFDVHINAPLALAPYMGDVRRLVYRCDTAQLPGRTFATAEQKIGSNPVEKFPYLTTYNDMDLTFIVDDDMKQKTFFDRWLELINPTFNFNYQYKQNYATIITINQYDVTNTLSYSVDLFDAYPISMNQLDLDWSNEGFHKLAVTFAYTRWQNNSVQNLVQNILQEGLSTVVNDVFGSSLNL